MLDIKYLCLKNILKVQPDNEEDKKLALMIEKKLNMNSLLLIIKVFTKLRKKRNIKRVNTINYMFLLKPKLTNKEIQGKQILEARLNNINCELIKIIGDGNCLFRSISCNLFKKQKYHSYVRKTCVQHMLSNKHEYSIFFENNEFEKYLKNMSKCGFWGDELCIKATADAFNCVVYIITSTDKNWKLKYESKKINNFNKSIFLAYLSPVHYDCFRLKKNIK